MASGAETRAELRQGQLCRRAQYRCVPCTCRAHLHIGVSVAPQRRGRLRCDFATVRDPDQGEVAFVVPASVQLTCKRVGRPLEGIVGGKGGRQLFRRGWGRSAKGDALARVAVAAHRPFLRLHMRRRAQGPRRLRSSPHLGMRTRSRRARWRARARGGRGRASTDVTESESSFSARCAGDAGDGPGCLPGALPHWQV